MPFKVLEMESQKVYGNTLVRFVLFVYRCCSDVRFGQFPRVNAELQLAIDSVQKQPSSTTITSFLRASFTPYDGNPPNRNEGAFSWYLRFSLFQKRTQYINIHTINQELVHLIYIGRLMVASIVINEKPNWGGDRDRVLAMIKYP